MNSGRAKWAEHLRRTARRRSVPGASGMPSEPVIGVIAGFVLAGCLFAANMLGTLRWPEDSNPSGMDLSRRLVFAFSSAVELYGAGLVGFALGVGAAQRRAIVHPSAAGRALRLRTWRGPMIVIGVLLILVAGRYEYLALVGNLE